MNFQKYIFRVGLLTLLFLALITEDIFSQQDSSYTVKQGDTLYSISKKLEVTIAELQEWNNIQGTAIEVGQELTYYLPEEVKSNEPPPPPSNPIVNTSGTAGNMYYTVKSGDNLYKIAREHNMTLEQLKELNNLTGDNIRVGQKLTVKKITVAPSVSENSDTNSPQGKFSLYTLESGESLNDILTKFKMSRQEFRALNTEINVDNLSRGQKVAVLTPPSGSYENPYLKKANLQDLGTVPAITYTADETGATTTNGELYDPDALTAAHSNIALGSIIFVENKATGNGIYVRINDRITGSGLKLSAHAFRTLKLDKTPQPAVTIYTNS